jgi:heme exporter protein D
MMDWFAMGGYGGYVWGSYGVALAAIVAEVILLGARNRRALTRARAEAENGDGT